MFDFGTFPDDVNLTEGYKGNKYSYTTPLLQATHIFVDSVLGTLKYKAK